MKTELSFPQSIGRASPASCRPVFNHPSGNVLVRGASASCDSAYRGRESQKLGRLIALVLPLAIVATGCSGSSGSASAGGTTATGGSDSLGGSPMATGGVVASGGTTALSPDGGTTAGPAEDAAPPDGPAAAPDGPTIIIDAAIAATGGIVATSGGSTAVVGGSSAASGGSMALTGGSTLSSAGGAATGGSRLMGGSSTGGGTTGGVAVTGGTKATGGTTSPDGGAGSGCTGPLEEIQSATGLCVAKMATITGPPGAADYEIDVTEVTRKQYQAWVATNPALPASTDADCGWKSTGSYVNSDCMAVARTPPGCITECDNHPQICVDWCDAFAYCQGVGKRLCGKIGGGSIPTTAHADASLSQWYRACSAAGTTTYPYGMTYQPGYCDGADYSTTVDTVPVGSLATCVTSASGYAGVYDLSGNVGEWEDSCSGTGQSAMCTQRGGATMQDSTYLTCATAFVDERYFRPTNIVHIGFRCCSI